MSSSLRTVATLALALAATLGHADTMETNLSEITPAFKEIDKKRATAVSDQLKKLGVTNSIIIDLM